MLWIPLSTSVWEYRTRPVVTSTGSVSVQRNFEMCLNTISCVQITAATIMGGVTGQIATRLYIAPLWFVEIVATN